MGIFERIRRKSAAAGAMVMYRTGQAAARTTSVNSIAKEGYTKNPDVYAAITGITTAAKGIEWGLLKLSNRGKQKGYTPESVRSVLATAGSRSW